MLFNCKRKSVIHHERGILVWYHLSYTGTQNMCQIDSSGRGNWFKSGDSILPILNTGNALVKQKKLKLVKSSALFWNTARTVLMDILIYLFSQSSYFKTWWSHNRMGLYLPMLLTMIVIYDAILPEIESSVRFVSLQFLSGQNVSACIFLQVFDYIPTFISLKLF